MSGLSCIWLFGSVLLATAASDHVPQTRKVVIDQGPVIGHLDPQGDNYAFYDIPYATAPSGPNKFKAPLPPPTWQDPFDAVDRGVVCPQINNPLLTPDKVIQEDCLVASVYVPNNKKVTNLPVYVYVHGGGFQVGSGNGMPSAELMKSKDFILVKFNYRLGVHGFLCLGTEKAQGNAGMKDQVALLRWVKRNIASFGGNPDDVTIGGGSAGAAAVDLLLLSQSARGLFNKVIAESGSSISVFSIQYNPIENAKAYAKSLNFTEYDDFYALENFFTSASYEHLYSVPFWIKTDSTLGLTLCVERPAGEEIFIDDSPLNILKCGMHRNVPLLYGFANSEGIIQISIFEDWSNKMNNKFSEFLPADLQFDTEENRETVAQQIKDFYFGKQIIGETTIQSYIDYFSDIMFTYPALKSLELQKFHGNDNIYLYEYTYYDGDGTLVGYKDYKVKGATHCAQSVAIFDGHYTFMNGKMTFEEENNLSDDYRQIKSTVREMWRNFIIKGEPVPMSSSLPTWSPMGTDWSPHMSLGHKVEMKGSLLLERTRFWDRIYERHYRKPVAPPSPPLRHLEL